MSAYGAITSTRKQVETLPSTFWRLKPRNRTLDAAGGYLTIHHVTLESAREIPGLISYLHFVFTQELERGSTYPQEILPDETYTVDAFEAYYFAADVLVAVLCSSSAPSDDFANGAVVELSLEQARKERSWEDSIAGCYYVKPNYPGRSSHICNAGFLVPPIMRAKGIGLALGQSYLHYGPRLGYEASVFNLVYVNNVASVRIWESLGFEKAGRIPRAGRLKKVDGSPGEEYVDAWVFYRRFDSDADTNSPLATRP
ncbi:hypothetical protein CERSUDRAFT_118204 [Gelatoporia subvermispora B]|uniref:N-acetyltransferase domain-containing protein n=1 Tax=Ceriporiopsis subvermispora (strain B) TaxID=914234 RepID=M2QLV3_CERS8|nr:hypothetical protein CERSUDRAFT_118204 [Gelatoporia subvermispora B]